jgi:hypothetical protein
MQYPSKEEIREADKIQLATWCRFLPSPGTTDVGNTNFQDVMEKEIEILDLILTKFSELGGRTP